MNQEQTFETYRQTILGQDAFNVVVALLSNSSQWFEVTPLPDDRWEIKVKEENKGFLQRAVIAAVDL